MLILFMFILFSLAKISKNPFFVLVLSNILMFLRYWNWGFSLVVTYIIKIKRNKHLKYISLCGMNVYIIQVSLFEWELVNKSTFWWYSNYMTSTCIYTRVCLCCIYICRGVMHSLYLRGHELGGCYVTHSSHNSTYVLFILFLFETFPNA